MTKTRNEATRWTTELSMPQPFQIVGKGFRTQSKNGENLKQIPEFWHGCQESGFLDKLAELAANDGVCGGATLGICLDFAADMSEFTYMAAVERKPEGDMEGLTERTIPATTWAVFEARGELPGSIQDVWARIWSKFFATAPYTHGDAPDLELYPRANPDQPDQPFEVWVPVVKKV